MRQDEQNVTKKLIQENIRLTKQLFVEIKKIKRWIALQRVFTILKILIVVVPIVLAVIYLPPFLEPYFEKIQALFNLASDPSSVKEAVGE